MSGAALIFSTSAQGQTISCTKKAFAALKPLPELKYRCPEDLQDFDDKILTNGARVTSTKKVEKSLSAFTEKAWWETPAEELNLCYFKKKIGALTPDEREKIRNEEFTIALSGDSHVRLVSIADPCYQAEYNGSNVYLLVRSNNKTTVSTLVNGYFSRLPNSVSFGSADLNGEEIVAVQSDNELGMYPVTSVAFFVIDKNTGKAAPKNLIKSEEGELSSSITSDGLLGDYDEKTPMPLDVINRNKLAPSFVLYETGGDKIIDSTDRKEKKIIYRWNGSFFAPEK